jgi:hypothetical protein
MKTAFKILTYQQMMLKIGDFSEYLAPHPKLHSNLPSAFFVK